MKSTKNAVPLLGSNLGAFAQEMFGLDSAAPISKAEIREGIDRLGALTRKGGDVFDDLTGFSDLTAMAKVDVGIPISDLKKSYGVDSESACVVFDLAVALVTSRLTAAEIFRLGTSEEAIRLFETECDEWKSAQKRAADDERLG